MPNLLRIISSRPGARPMSQPSPDALLATPTSSSNMQKHSLPDILQILAIKSPIALVVLDSLARKFARDAIAATPDDEGEDA